MLCEWPVALSSRTIRQWEERSARPLEVLIENPVCPKLHCELFKLLANFRLNDGAHAGCAVAPSMLAELFPGDDYKFQLQFEQAKRIG